MRNLREILRLRLQASRKKLGHPLIENLRQQEPERFGCDFPSLIVCWKFVYFVRSNDMDVI